MEARGSKLHQPSHAADNARRRCGLAGVSWAVHIVGAQGGDISVETDYFAPNSNGTCCHSAETSHRNEAYVLTGKGGYHTTVRVSPPVALSKTMSPSS